jgi:hypothetical protein
MIAYNESYKKRSENTEELLSIYKKNVTNYESVFGYFGTYQLQNNNTDLC